MVFLKADQYHIASVMNLATKLFDEHEYEELRLDMTEVVQSENVAVFLCFDSNIEVGFAEQADLLCEGYRNAQRGSASG
jgi:hypothetical protein